MLFLGSNYEQYNDDTDSCKNVDIAKKGIKTRKGNPQSNLFGFYFRKYFDLHVCTFLL